jgi:pentatricopeptide repeat protein
MARHLRDNLQESAAAAGNGNGKAAASRADLTTYTALAKGFANHGLHEEALRLLDDARAVGVEPDVNLWNQVLKVRRT